MSDQLFHYESQEGDQLSRKFIATDVAGEIRAFNRPVLQRGTFIRTSSSTQRRERKKERETDSQCRNRVTDRRCWRRNAGKRDFRWILSSAETQRTISSHIRRSLWGHHRRFPGRCPPRSAIARLAQNAIWSSRVAYTSPRGRRWSPLCPRAPQSYRARCSRDLYSWAEVTIIRGRSMLYGGSRLFKGHK